MPDDRGARARALFREALALSPSARETFLDDTCSGDAELRSEVEALLAAARPQSPGALAGAREARPLDLGTRLGPYQIVAPIGAGGMGEVYEARDTRLDRTVAIKILPAAISDDPTLRRRFEREGRAISQLNHPNICTLYDVGRDVPTSAERPAPGAGLSAVEFMVMERLVGETLAARLARGRLRFDETLAIARDVLAALDAAHSRGITHRDLKPANVMLVKAGGSRPGSVQVKLLDFGLAKLQNPGVAVTRLLDSRLGPDGPLPSADDDALTREHPLTGARTILGTLHYMAPEQIEGHEADARTDIFAFGLLLYEMVTGRRAFEASSQAGLIGAILLKDPAPIRERDPGVPPAVEALVSRCLAKDPEHRWQSARDLLWHVEMIGSAAHRAVPERSRSARRTHFWWAAAVAVAVLATAVGFSSRSRDPLLPAVRAHVDVPAGGRLAPEYYPAVAVSPDGARIVFRATTMAGSVLMLRRIDAGDAQPIPGTENAHTPFFSPDGQWLGFMADKKVKKVPVAGGLPMVVCTASSLSPGSPGAAWGPDDSIVFAAATNGLMRVAAAGGEAEQLTTRDEARGENTHHSPQFLPGGRTVLFTVKGVDGESHAAILSLDTREWRWIDGLGALSGAARYTESGHLVFPESGGAGQLRAVPFDVGARRVSGPAVPLLDEVYMQASSDVSIAQFATSQAGVLAYVTGRPPAWSLVRVGLDGTSTPIVADRRTYRYPRASPDGRQIAVSVAEDRSDIYIANVERGTLRRITTLGGNTQPVWTPDGARVVFTSTRPGTQGYDLHALAADVAGDVPPDLLVRRADGQFPSSWSPEAPRLAFYEFGGSTARDLWVWSADTGESTRVLATPASERAAVFSPDGAWLAYVSDESGRDEVYIQRYPGPGGLERVSTDGGTEPAWAPRGSELYYRNGRQLLAVTVDRERGRVLGLPRLVLEGAFELAPSDVGRANYDVFPDGRSFVFVESERTTPDWHVHVVLNWHAELRQPLASRRP